MGITVKVEFIGPETAKMYLAAMVSNYRTKRRIHVEQYVRKIETGQWNEGASVIRFDINGKLIDGQHTLEAIIQSGVAATVVVIRGMVNADGVDSGLGRRGSDALAEYPDARKRASYIRAIHVQPSAGNIDHIYPADYRILNAIYEPTITWCCEQFNTHSTFSQAPVVAAFGRALMVKPALSDRLQVAIQKCIGLSFDKEDETLRLLVRYVMTDKGSAGCASKIKYLKAANAIQLWLNHARVSKLICPSKDPFPKPIQYIEKLRKCGLKGE